MRHGLNIGVPLAGAVLGLVQLAHASAAPSDVGGSRPVTEIRENPEAGSPDKRRAEPSTAKLTLRYSILAGVPLSVMIYGKEIWRWGDRGAWRWGTEGWFGRNTDHGGADKLGHTFAMYTLTRGTTRIMEFTGLDHDRSLLYGALMGTGIGLGIEVGDAYTGKYGFSYEDLIADLSGVALGVLLEKQPVLDSLMGISIEYFPTRSFREYPGRKWLEFEGDTGGFNYMLNFRLAGLHNVGVNLPRPFDFFTADVGYFTRGFSRFDEARQINERIRYWFVGASLNVPEIIAALTKPSAGSRFFQDFFSYVHLPLGVKGSSAID